MPLPPEWQHDVYFFNEGRSRRVLIGTPTYDWAVDCRYTDSLLATERLLGSHITLRAVFIPGNAFVDDARNELVGMALANNYDDLVFIDADQDWQPEWFARLLDYPVDCVGAPVRKKTDDKEAYNVKARGGVFSLTRHETLPLLTAPDMAIGTGFIRYSRKALQLLWRAAPVYRGLGGDTERRLIFEKRIVNGEMVSEDTWACDRLTELGIPIWLDPHMNPGHGGLKRFEGDFAGWLKREMEAGV